MSGFLKLLFPINWNMLVKVILIVPMYVISYLLTKKVQLAPSEILEASKTLIIIVMGLSLAHFFVSVMICNTARGFHEDEKVKRARRGNSSAEISDNCYTKFTKYGWFILMTCGWMPANIWYSVLIGLIANKATIDLEDDNELLNIGKIGEALMWLTFTADLLMVYPVIRYVGKLCSCVIPFVKIKEWRLELAGLTTESRPTSAETTASRQGPANLQVTDSEQAPQTVEAEVHIQPPQSPVQSTPDTLVVTVEAPDTNPQPA